MVLFLTLLSGICWTIAYVEIIRLGFRDKLCGMPLFALALNITWEGIQSFHGLQQPSITLETWGNTLWFVLDLFIVYVHFKYGKKEFTPYANKRYFIPWSIFVFFLSFCVEYSFIVEFGTIGSTYAAFIQNVIMSVLFIRMLLTRKNIKAQNQIIAVNKWIGTLAATLLAGVIYGNQLVIVLGVCCYLFDLIYVVLLNKKMKIDTLHPS